MKIKLSICSLFIIALILGCSSISNAASIATASQMPLSTNTSTRFPTNTPTQLITSTSTPGPTLEPTQAEDAIKTLLWNNPNCSFPCFIDIIPGHTTIDEAQNLFRYLGLGLELTTSENKNNFYAASHKFESGLAIRMRLKVQSGVVQDIDIPITLPQDQNGIVQQEWSTYLPDALIRQYGMPTKVNFFVGRGPTPSYAMDLYFDSVDLIVEYYSYDLGANLQICPLTDQMKSVRIWIGKEPVNPPLETVHLNDATSLTMQEFSKMMTGDPNKACFLLKSDVFP